MSGLNVGSTAKRNEEISKVLDPVCSVHMGDAGIAWLWRIFQ